MSLARGAGVRLCGPDGSPDGLRATFERNENQPLRKYYHEDTVVCSTLDLSYKLGCTPSWWQLLKALYEVGNEVIAIPYLGDLVESPWWRTYPNPCSDESSFLQLVRRVRRRAQAVPDRSIPAPVSVLIDRHVKRKWENHLLSILAREKDVDAVFMMNIPINHIQGIPTKIRESFRHPRGLLRWLCPIILPKYAMDRGFKFNYYLNADLSGVRCVLQQLDGRHSRP